MSNNSNKDNARSSGQKKGDFGEPSDDSFRNYMANKIDKQREQFGLVIPPPPPPSLPTIPLPKKILKKTKFTKQIDKNNATTKSTHNSSLINNDNDNVNDKVIVEKKSVRFHQNVEVEGVAQVLENLKRRHSSSGGISSGGKRRVGRSSSGRGSKRRRRKSSQQDNIESSSSSTTEFTSILGVLDSLQKKHDHITSSQRNRRSSTSSQEYRTDDDTNDALEDYDSLLLKRKKESPRCKGKSILEGLDTGVESTESPSQAASLPAEVVNTNKPSTPKLKSGHRPDLFFTGIVVLVNGHTNPDATTLMRLLHKHGGDLEKYETHRVTHIIAEQLSSAKANVYKRQKKPIPVCRPEWVTDSVDQGKLLPFGDYLLEDVVDKESTGTKSVKSFFNTTKPSEESSKNDTSAADNKKMSPKKDSESTVTSKRWRDRLPSEASYSLNDKVRTTGNDPNFLASYFANSRLSYIGSFKQRIKPNKKAGCSSPSKVGAHKFVLLVDMDCFFASVILRKYPQYKNKPVAVGHCHIARSGSAEEASAGKTQKDSSSELSTCNYIARNRGVRKGMFLGDAIAQCPDLVVLPYDFEGYEEVSGIVVDHLQSIAEQYNGCVEVVSCDESYVEIHISPEDCSDGDVYDFVKSLAENIRTDIEKKTECTASIGIGVNKLLAKLAADRIKPNACCVVKDWRGFLDEVPLRSLPGIGRKLEKKLQPHNFSTVNDVWDLGDDADNVLSEIIGRTAQKIIQFCQGKDERPITPVVRKSIGSECNYGVRFDNEMNNIYGVDHMMKELAKEVNKRMQSVEVKGSKLVLKVMISADPSKMPGKFLGHGKCTSLSASQDIQLTRDDAIISSAAMKLYKKLNVDDSSLRGMGIVVQSLRFDNEVSSSPSKLSAWLQKDTATSNNSVSKSQLTDDVASGSHVAFEDNDNDDTMSNMSSTVPTFSQLDKDVLENLPDDILLEVKSIYGKKTSSQHSPSQQLSPLKSSNKTKGKAKRDVVSIAGQPSVTRMFKLASVKCGEEEMGDNDLSLSQLDCLPLELQLQIANGDDVEVTRRPRQSSKSKESIVDQTDTNEILPNSMQNQDYYTAEDPSTVNFHEENIVPLLDFITANPDPDESAVSAVHDFLSCIIQERRIEHTTIFLRTIKNNMKDGWTNDIYKQLRRVAIEEIKQKTGSVLDVKWLGI